MKIVLVEGWNAMLFQTRYHFLSNDVSQHEEYQKFQRSSYG